MGDNMGLYFLCADGIYRKVVFSYPNALIKKIKNKLIEKKGKCDLCSKTDKLELHHLDYNRYHNNPENLKLLCRECHINWHKQNPQTRTWKKIIKSEQVGDKIIVKEYELYSAKELMQLK